MDKSALKRAYKENPPAAGIFTVTNKANGKILLGKGMNARGILNSQQAQLQFGSHRNLVLQQEYDRFGAGMFEFRVVDELDRTEKSPAEIEADLTVLEALWLDKLQPYGERGYHKAPEE
jgi:hypothetical protein